MRYDGSSEAQICHDQQTQFRMVRRLEPNATLKKRRRRDDEYSLFLEVVSSLVPVRLFRRQASASLEAQRQQQAAGVNASVPDDIGATPGHTYDEDASQEKDSSASSCTASSISSSSPLS
jgi:hypothetical protein